VTPPHRDGGQQQYITALLTDSADGDRLADVIAWARDNLDRQLSLDELAARSRTSRRSFVRHFKAATGATPRSWLLSQRLNLAEELLETTSLPIEQIADRVGYRSAAVFREQFTARRGVPPRDYRQTFRTMVLAVSGTYRRPASRQHAGREPEPGIMRAARNTTTPMPGTPNRQVRFALRY